MRIPESLASLADYGIIQEVLRPLMSGKEAQIYLVVAGGEERVAKVYKEANNRSFRQRSEYMEGRKVRNSRDQRAMAKGSRHGRAQDEAAWRTAEVEVIYRLQAAEVRVPVPHHFIDGVLVMELIKDADGLPARRLGDLGDLSADEARHIFDILLGHVVRMLSAGVVHGDLSDFNVLMAADGPVIIDFPQAVDASSNQNARKLLIRDVDNLHRFLERFAGPQRRPPFAQEMWDLYQRGQLLPDTKLSGRHRASERKADVKDVLSLIGDAEHDERRRRQALGVRMPGSVPSASPSEAPLPARPVVAGRRVMVEIAAPPQARSRAGRREGPRDGRRGARQEGPRPADPGGRRAGQPGDRRDVAGGGASDGSRAPRSTGPRGERRDPVVRDRRDDRGMRPGAEGSSQPASSEPGRRRNRNRGHRGRRPVDPVATPALAQASHAPKPAEASGEAPPRRRRRRRRRAAPE